MSKRIVFFGDSLTRADYLEEGFVELVARDCPEIEAINAGVNGDTSDDLLERLPGVASLRPDRVYLMVGTNDCGWKMRPSHYRENLERLVKGLLPAEIVLITPTTGVGHETMVRPYVAAVKEVGKLFGLPVVDFSAEIQSSDYGPDGLHWNSAGHRRLAERISREAPAC